MSQGTVEERLDRLEKLMDGVLDRLSATSTRQKDWRRTVGMFRGDPIMKEITEEALRSRQEERARFYEEYDAVERNPWLAIAGTWRHNPDVEEVMENIRTYRREVDADPERL